MPGAVDRLRGLCGAVDLQNCASGATRPAGRRRGATTTKQLRRDPLPGVGRAEDEHVHGLSSAA